MNTQKRHKIIFLLLFLMVSSGAAVFFCWHHFDATEEVSCEEDFSMSSQRYADLLDSRDENKNDQIIVTHVERKRKAPGACHIPVPTPEIDSVNVPESKSLSGVLGQNNAPGFDWSAYDDNTDVPQTLQEMERYIDDLAQQIAKLLEEDEGLRKLLDDISQSRPKSGKNIHDTIIDRGLGYGKNPGQGPIELGDDEFRRFQNEIKNRRSRLQNWQYERQERWNNFNEVNAENERQEAHFNFLKRSYNKLETVGASLDAKMAAMS